MSDIGTNLRSTIRSTARRVRQQSDSPFSSVVLRQGVVQASPGGGVLTIRLGGSTTDIAGVHYLSSYTANVGDVVWVLQASPDLLILGKLHT